MPYVEPSRPRSHERSCPTWCGFPKVSAGPASRSPQGRASDEIERLVASTNTALEALRELTRGVFPTQLARAGIEPALRSFLARSGLASTLQVDPSAAERRFSARAEAAVYFGAAEVARSVPGLSSIELSVDRLRNWS